MNARNTSGDEKEYQGIHAEDEYTDVDGTADTGVDGKIAALLVALMVRISAPIHIFLFFLNAIETVTQKQNNI